MGTLVIHAQETITEKKIKFLHFLKLIFISLNCLTGSSVQQTDHLLVTKVNEYRIYSKIVDCNFLVGMFTKFLFLKWDVLGFFIFFGRMQSINHLLSKRENGLNDDGNVSRRTKDKKMMMLGEPNQSIHSLKKPQWCQLAFKFALQTSNACTLYCPTWYTLL